MKVLKSLQKGWKHNKLLVLHQYFMLDLVKVDSTVMLNNGKNKTNICWAKDLMALKQVRVLVWISDSTIFCMKREYFICKWLFDAWYATDIIDAIVVFVTIACFLLYFFCTSMLFSCTIIGWLFESHCLRFFNSILSSWLLIYPFISRIFSIEYSLVLLTVLPCSFTFHFLSHTSHSRHT